MTMHSFDYLPDTERRDQTDRAHAAAPVRLERAARSRRPLPRRFGALAVFSLAWLMLVGCAPMHRQFEPPQDPNLLPDTLFLHYLTTVPVATVDEGYRAVLLVMEAETAKAAEADDETDGGAAPTPAAGDPAPSESSDAKAPPTTAERLAQELMAHSEAADLGNDSFADSSITPAAAAFAARQVTLLSRRVIRPEWALDADQVLDFGTLAYMLRRVGGLRPGVNELLAEPTGIGSRRYALRTCVAEGLLPYAQPYQPVSGGALLAAITRTMDRLSPPASSDFAPEEIAEPAQPAAPAVASAVAVDGRADAAEEADPPKPAGAPEASEYGTDSGD
jgi:hypothetical protein